MSRYIDADALIGELEECSYETWSKGVNRAWWAHAVNVKDNIVACIKRQPTADVVEVVRCKDCKHYKGEQSNCWLMRTKMQSTDYCSYGERREE